jgi:hypothetical protein
MKQHSARTRCGEKEKALMNVGVGYETADYKYFVTLCRGFSEVRRRKTFRIGQSEQNSISTKPGTTKSALGLSQIHDHQLRLRHFFDGIAHTLAAQARILHAPVRHLVHPKRRNISCDQAADFQFFKSLKH